LRFDVSCDHKELREYWNRSGYDGNLDYLMNVVIKDSSQLIVWREDNKVLGHAARARHGFDTTIPSLRRLAIESGKYNVFEGN
jgi:hypothetical protein